MLRFAICPALMCLVLVGAVSAQVEKKSDATDKQIGELVSKLGDPQFKVRQEAHKALVEIGRPALPRLQTAAQNEDVEIQMRARRIIKEIEARPPR